MGLQPHDEWILGENAEGDRRYLIHTVDPVFVAEVFQDSNPDGILAPFSYDLGDGWSLANLLLDDEPPTLDELMPILSEASVIVRQARWWRVIPKGELD